MPCCSLTLAADMSGAGWHPAGSQPFLPLPVVPEGTSFSGKARQPHAVFPFLSKGKSRDFKLIGNNLLSLP